MLNPMLDVGHPVSSGISDWNATLRQLNKWLAWIKREYGPFEKNFTQTLHGGATHNQIMNEEEIVKKQAEDAVKIAEGYGVHYKLDQYIDVIRERSARIYSSEYKALYFQEAIRLVNGKVISHRSTCQKGPNCPTEQRYEQVLFHLQQEVSRLSTPTNTPTQSQPSAPPVRNTMLEKIFISHSSQDASIVEEVIDLLEDMGVKAEQIFCSSFQGYSIKLGEDFLQRIKDELNSNVLVLFMLTPNFYKSPVCLCEMGAAWVKTSKHIPVIIPPIEYKDIEGVIPLTQGFKIDEPLKWNLLKEQVEEWFGIANKASASVWERKRDKAISAISSKLQPITPAATKPPRRGGSSKAL